jgi:hypothetical protein
MKYNELQVFPPVVVKLLVVVQKVKDLVLVRSSVLLSRVVNEHLFVQCLRLADLRVFVHLRKLCI